MLASKPCFNDYRVRQTGCQLKISACVAVNALVEIQGKRSSVAQLMAFEVTAMLQAS